MLQHVAVKDSHLPIQFSGWTVAALVDWIAADDARCHDERLRAPLEAVLGEEGERVPIVALVRMLVRRLREDPMVSGSVIAAPR